MDTALEPCPTCARHVRVSEARCPFCGASCARPGGLPASASVLVALAAVASLAACYGRPPTRMSDASDPRLGATAPAATGSIGSATMEADGTLVLMLRAESPGGAVGDAQFRYPPSHPEYARILAHVGPIRPGETRPVAPFP